MSAEEQVDMKSSTMSLAESEGGGSNSASTNNLMVTSAISEVDRQAWEKERLQIYENLDDKVLN